MAKLPDFSKIAKNLDLQHFVDDLKSMLGAAGEIPEEAVEQGDPIATKMAQISILVKQVAETYTKQAKELHKIHSLINELYKDIAKIREAELKPEDKNDEDGT